MKIKIAYQNEYQEYLTAVGQWSYETGSYYDPSATAKDKSRSTKNTVI